jgi:drug/metabolite transporter (DMT)-like permease
MSTGARGVAAWVWLVLLWLVWGSSWPAMRAVFLEIQVWQFRAITCLLGGLALLLIARLWRVEWRVPRAQWAPLLAASFFNIIVWHVATGYALHVVGAGHAALVCYTMPVWTALLSALFLREPLTAHIGVALVLGLLGIGVLMSNDWEQLRSNPWGYAYVLAAAICWAAGTIVAKGVRWQAGMTALAGWQLAIGAVPIGVIALLTERFTIHEASQPALIGAAYILLFGVIAGYALWFRIVELFPASIGAISTLVIPVVGVASGALLLAEPVGWRELTALALVLSAVGLALFSPPRVAPAAEAAR